ncbi:MAG: polysaccharide deacetylase family protein [Firmicutes bacterium]|nr:polysaccharide deacetylase family protein [Bacillota bacterium]
MFKKIIKRKRLILAVLGITAAFSLSFGIVRPALISHFYPTVQTSAAKKMLPIYCVDTKGEKKIAVSFDAAWGADDTDTLLDILQKNNVKATFFLCGYWVDKYPDEVKKIYDSGHDIGNHSNTHPHSSQLSLEQNKENIMACHDKIKSLLGYDAFLYRPPFGEYNDTVLNAAKECGYYSVQWDVDSLDWKELGTDHEINQVLNHKHLGNGSIILFHNDAKYTPEVLDDIIKGLKEKGYEIVPISELIHKENYYMDHEGRQIPK